MQFNRRLTDSTVKPRQSNMNIRFGVLSRCFKYDLIYCNIQYNMSRDARKPVFGVSDQV